MTEEEIFYLRKLHFLVDFCWNIEVYKPLLKVSKLYEIDPIDVLVKIIEESRGNLNKENLDKNNINNFFEKFDKSSREEWFNTSSEIESYFKKSSNFDKLLNNEFDKLNILYSVILLKDFKNDFDKSILDIIRSYKKIPNEILEPTANLSFAAFPSLKSTDNSINIEVPNNLSYLNEETVNLYKPSKNKIELKMVANSKRREMLNIIETSSQSSLSKILNTQGFSLSDLKLTTKKLFSFDNNHRRAEHI
jgi:hypothetical protein